MFLLSFQNRRFRDLLFIFLWKSMLFCVCCLVIFSKNFLSSLQSKDEWMLPAKWIRHGAQQKGSRPESSGFLDSDWVWLSPPVCPLGSALALSPFFCYCQNNHCRIFREPLSETTASLVLCQEGAMGSWRGELSLSCPGCALPELTNNLYFLIYRQSIWWLMHDFIIQSKWILSTLLVLLFPTWHI